MAINRARFHDPNAVISQDEIQEVETTMAAALHPAPESLFWYWVAERHAVYLRRQAGQPKPWTEDPIMQRYKFTNPFRENDRGTVWLRENFLEPHRNDPLNDLAFNIAWFRMFNWTGTGELLGWQTHWNPERVKMTLKAAAERGDQIFTGAHIVYSPPGRPKIDAIVDVCSDLYELTCKNKAVVNAGGLNLTFTELCRFTKELRMAFLALQTVHCVGGFMAYEMVSDMRHTRLLEDAVDIMTWANMGPGAKRGLMRLGLPCRNQDEGVHSMFDLLEHGRFNGWAGDPEPEIFRNQALPALEMRDIEHSLCEFDKYCRVKFGEGEPRSKFNGV